MQSNSGCSTFKCNFSLCPALLVQTTRELDFPNSFLLGKEFKLHFSYEATTRRGNLKMPWRGFRRNVCEGSDIVNM